MMMWWLCDDDETVIVMMNKNFVDEKMIVMMNENFVDEKMLKNALLIFQNMKKEIFFLRIRSWKVFFYSCNKMFKISFAIFLAIFPTKNYVALLGQVRCDKWTNSKLSICTFWNAPVSKSYVMNWCNVIVLIWQKNMSWSLTLNVLSFGKRSVLKF